jgi:hypothetical protein
MIIILLIPFAKDINKMPRVTSIYFRVFILLVEKIVLKQTMQLRILV